MGKRIKTNYPGVFYRESVRIGVKGTEKIYYILFKKDGKVFEEKAGRQYSDNMTPAKAAGIRAERIEGKRLSKKQLRNISKQKAERWTISRLWDDYLQNRFNLKGVVTDTNRFKNHIEPSLGNKEIQDILPLDLDRIRLRLQKTHKPGTVKNVFELIRRIINYGVKKNLTPPLNFRLEMPKADSLKTEDLSPEQLQRLLAVIETSDDIQAAGIMKMALFTGMRRSEIFRLKWSDIDQYRGFIKIRNPKGGKDQEIPLNEGAQTVLTNHIKTESPFVFPGRGGGQRIDVKKAVNRIKQKAGLPQDFRALHGLRHVYASMLASSGQVDLYTLQRLLCHKSPSMTMRYAHLRDQSLKDASGVASNIIIEAMSKKIEAAGNGY